MGLEVVGMDYDGYHGYLDQLGFCGFSGLTCWGGCGRMWVGGEKYGS